MSLIDQFRAAFIEQPVQIDLSPRAKPTLAAVNSAPTREEFDAWRDDHTTRFVMMALRSAQAAQMSQWLVESWDGGAADPIVLATLRARADAYAGIEEADYDGFCEWAGLERGE